MWFLPIFAIFLETPILSPVQFLRRSSIAFFQRAIDLSCRRAKTKSSMCVHVFFCRFCFFSLNAKFYRRSSTIRATIVSLFFFNEFCTDFAFRGGVKHLEKSHKLFYALLLIHATCNQGIILLFQSLLLNFCGFCFKQVFAPVKRATHIRKNSVVRKFSIFIVNQIKM